LSKARGKYAYGYCDRTGFRYPLRDLVPEIFNQRPTGFLIGKDVVDPDQPQLQVGKLLLDDPKPLINPRPDRSLDESRILSSFDPVGQVGLGMTSSVGRVTVTTS